MKKLSNIAILIFGVFVAIACSEEMTRSYTKPGYSFKNKKKIALINVSVQTGRDGALVRRNVMTEFQFQLKKSGYDVVSLDETEKILKELNLPYDREYTQSEIDKIKEKLSVEILVIGFVSEEAESLISDDMNINFHFKYYDGSNAKFVAEALYQYKGEDTIIEAKLIKKAVNKILAPLGIKKD